MAIIRVYSRRPLSDKFQFTTIINGQMTPVDNTETIVINGANECINDGLVSTVGLTVFKGEKRNPKAGTYSEADFARLKVHPIFQAAIANGDYSYKESELSEAATNSQMVTAKELEQNPLPNGDDGLVVMKPKNMAE